MTSLTSISWRQLIIEAHPLKLLGEHSKCVRDVVSDLTIPVKQIWLAASVVDISVPEDHSGDKLRAIGLTLLHRPSEVIQTSTSVQRDYFLITLTVFSFRTAVWLRALIIHHVEWMTKTDVVISVHVEEQVLIIGDWLLMKAIERKMSWLSLEGHLTDLAWRLTSKVPCLDPLACNGLLKREGGGKQPLAMTLITSLHFCILPFGFLIVRTWLLTIWWTTKLNEIWCAYDIGRVKLLEEM